MLILSVADTGLGMSQERCEEVAAAMKEHRTAKIGIGLGNIYKRVHMMYQREICGSTAGKEKEQ